MKELIFHDKLREILIRRRYTSLQKKWKMKTAKKIFNRIPNEVYNKVPESIQIRAIPQVRVPNLSKWKVDLRADYNFRKHLTKIFNDTIRMKDLEK
jgi:hypothetical protein